MQRVAKKAQFLAHLWHLLHFYEAHSTVSRDGETVVVAVPRYVYAYGGTRLENRGPGIHQNSPVVDEQFHLWWRFVSRRRRTVQAVMAS